MTIHRTKGIVRAEPGDGRNLDHVLTSGNTAAELRDAARQVHRRARDDDDRDELLDALGLTGVAT
jgi:hypothetical protein